MPRTGRPDPFAPGIYRHGDRLRVVAKYRRTQREKWYPVGTDLSVMQSWQLREKATLMALAPARPERGTLRADLPRYLATLTGRRLQDDTALARHWLETPLAALPRDQIQSHQIKAQRSAWLEAGVAASSINHRVRLLRNVYRELDGDDAPNPTDKIRKLPEPDPEPRDQPYDLLEAIIAWMPDRGRGEKGGTRPGVNKSKLRARVMLWTGLPPALLMKVRPIHFNRHAATLVVQPRRKGKGARGQTIPLLPQAVEALQQFFDAGATGPFSTSSFYQRWDGAQRRLVAALKAIAVEQGHDPDAVSLPRRIRPYDLRHSFGSEAWRRSNNNLLGVKTLMAHARLSSTERYVSGVVDAAAASVVESWGKPKRA